MTAYYNEIDPYCAQWLRNLIDAGHIAPGVVDERSIEDITPNELREYTQCHFFAGIGVWSYALRLAGWPDDRPVWTGSCPCQPFSAAGKGAGFADERHLWPAWQHLIAQCRPATVFGEQVASKAVDAWIDLVHADLEGMGYAFGCVPFPSAGVGAPHIRERAYWMAYAAGEGRGQAGRDAAGNREADQGRARDRAGDAGAHDEPFRVVARDARGLADSDHERRPGKWLLLRAEEAGRNEGEVLEAPGSRGIDRMADPASGGRRKEYANGGGVAVGDSAQGLSAGLVHGRSNYRPGPTNGRWRNADWIGCTDGRWRPVEPGTFPLVDWAPNRVGRLRAYGNAINAEAAAAVIRAYMEARQTLAARIAA